MGVPSPPSFDLISLIRTPIQTEIKPEPLALLAWGFVKPVLLLTADVALRGTSSDEGFLLLLNPRAAASEEPRDAYYVYPVPMQRSRQSMRK